MRKDSSYSGLKAGEGLVGWAGHRDQNASAHGPREREPGLIGHAGAEGVNIAEGDIRLSSSGLISGPIDVAASAGSRLGLDKEVGRCPMVLVAEVLVILSQVFVGVCRSVVYADILPAAAGRH